MTTNQTKRLTPTILQADLQAHTALQALPDYAPSNPQLAKTVLSQAYQAMRAAQLAEINAKNAADAARDTANAAEWQLHNLLLDVKDQVRAQYGKDSDALQSLGLKKKSERKKPSKKTT